MSIFHIETFADKRIYPNHLLLNHISFEAIQRQSFQSSLVRFFSIFNNLFLIFEILHYKAYL